MPAKTAPAVITRKNRETGTRITVAGEKGAWTVRCEDHDHTEDQPSRATRDGVARTPTAWCPVCAKAAKAAARKAAKETPEHSSPAAS